MKIIDLLKSDTYSLSFEVFPPKNEMSFDSVRAATEEIAKSWSSILPKYNTSKTKITKDELKGYMGLPLDDIIKKMFKDKKIILRIQSECFLGMYGDSHCDCESQRINSIKIIFCKKIV